MTPQKELSRFSKKKIVKLIALILDHPWALFFLVLYAFMVTTITLAGAWILASIVTKIYSNHATFTQIVPLCIFFGVLILLRFVLSFLCEWNIRRIASSIRLNLRKRFLQVTLNRPRLSSSGDTKGSDAALFSLATDDIEPWYSEFLPQLVITVLLVPSILVMALFFDPLAAGIMFVTIPLLPFFLSLIGSFVSHMQTKRLLALRNLGGKLLESLNGLKLLKRTNSGDRQSRTLLTSNDEFRKTTLEILKVSFLSAFVLELAATISIAIIAVSLGLRLINHSIPFFNAFIILLLAPELYLPIRLLAIKFHTATSGMAALDTIESLHIPLTAPSADRVISQTQNSTSNAPKGPGIVLTNVSTRYPNSLDLALHSITLAIPPRGIIALVGKSGSGKTTLLNTIFGFLPCETGSIFFDGINVNTLPAEQRVFFTGLVSQQPFLFEGTIADNIRLGSPDATIDEVIVAMQLAGGKNVLTTLEKGLETVIGENGIGVSKGEAQRITLARALLKKSTYLFLDEPTSALDSETEREILATLQSLSTHHSIIVIAHRPATVALADTILVLDKNTIAELGSHADLLARNGIYSSLVRSWESHETL